MLFSSLYKKTQKNSMGNTNLLLMITFALVAAMLCSDSVQAQQPDRDKLIQKVADNWIEIAETQFQRAMYAQAEQSLTRAQEYYEFLNPKQRQHINDLLNSIHSALAEEPVAEQQLDGINQLIENNQLMQAKSELQRLKKDKNLSETERMKILSMMKDVDGKIESRKFELQHLFDQSRQYYELGELEKAHSGFKEIADSGLDISYKGKTAGQYLAEIEKPKAENKQDVQSSAKTKPDKRKKAESDGLLQSGKDKAHKEKESAKTAIADKTSKSSEQPKLQDKGQVKVGRTATDTAKTNLRTGYAKALVRDANLKVGQYLAQNELGKAKSVVIETRNAVKSFENDIDPQTYIQLTAQLDGLADAILKQQQNK